MNKIVILTSLLILASSQQALAQSAAEVTVSAASVVFTQAGKDSLTLKGSSSGLSPVGAETVTFSAGPFRQQIRLQQFKRSKLVYTYTASKGQAGLSSLVLDFGKNRFSAKLQNQRFSGLTNPLALGLTVGADSACSMLKFGVKRNKWSFAEKTSTQYPCAIIATPVANPRGVWSDRATPVTVRAEVTATAFAPDNLSLYQVDASLNPQGSPLCQLLDNGNAGNGDSVAGDRSYSCIATIPAGNVGSLNLIVATEQGGKTTYSPGFSLPVVVPYSQQQTEQLIATQQSSELTWQAKLSQYGDTRKARQEAVATLKAQPGIHNAAVSADGKNVLLEFAGGVKGGLAFDPQNTLPPTSIASTNKPSVQSLANSVAALTTQSSSEPQPTTKPGNCDVAYWTPIEEPPKEHEPQDNTIRNIFRKPQPNVFHFEQFHSDETDVESLRMLTDYGTIILETPSADSWSHIAYLTNEKFTLQTFGSDAYMLDLLTGSLEVWFWLDRHGLGTWYYFFTPNFISTLDDRFKNAIVLVNSQRGNELASAFIGRNANSFIGLSLKGTDQATFDWADYSASQFLEALVAGKNSAEALAAITKHSGVKASLNKSVAANESAYIQFPQQLDIVSPANGSEIRGTVTVSVKTDTIESGCIPYQATAKLWVDGIEAASTDVTSSTFSFSFNASLLKPGKHTLSVELAFTGDHKRVATISVTKPQSTLDLSAYKSVYLVLDGISTQREYVGFDNNINIKPDEILPLGFGCCESYMVGSFSGTDYLAKWTDKLAATGLSSGEVTASVDDTGQTLLSFRTAVTITGIEQYDGSNGFDSVEIVDIPFYQKINNKMYYRLKGSEVCAHIRLLESEFSSNQQRAWTPYRRVRYVGVPQCSSYSDLRVTLEAF